MSEKLVLEGKEVKQTFDFLENRDIKRLFGSHIRRQENCTINMELELSAAKKHKRAAETLLREKSSVTMASSDTLKLHYSFRILYFGQIIENLRAVIRICKDPNVIINADCELLEEGRCLAYEALRNLDEAIKTVKHRQLSKTVKGEWLRRILRILTREK